MTRVGVVMYLVGGRRLAVSGVFPLAMSRSLIVNVAGEEKRLKGRNGNVVRMMRVEGKEGVNGMFEYRGVQLMEGRKAHTYGREEAGIWGVKLEINLIG